MEKLRYRLKEWRDEFKKRMDYTEIPLSEVERTNVKILIDSL